MGQPRPQTARGSRIQSAVCCEPPHHHHITHQPVPHSELDFNAANARTEQEKIIIIIGNKLNTSCSLVDSSIYNYPLLISTPHTSIDIILLPSTPNQARDCTPTHSVTHTDTQSGTNDHTLDTLQNSAFIPSKAGLARGIAPRIRSWGRTY